MTDYKVIFGRNLERLRRQNGYSQECLADWLKVSRSTIGAYEEYRNEPNLKFMVEAAAFFKVPIDELLKKTPNPKNKEYESKMHQRRPALSVGNSATT